jgi:2-methylcitrate dehydratase PrpD
MELERDPDTNPGAEDRRLNRRRLLQSSFASVVGGVSVWPAASQVQSTSPGSALTLSRILNRIDFASLPPTAIEHAKMILASTLASAAAGSRIDSARIIRELAKEQGGSQEAAVWFDGARLPVTQAARVNAMLSDAAASDDSDLRNVAHTGTCLTAVGLAMGERVGANGKETLSAMVAGYEAAGRVGEALAASSMASNGAGAISGAVGRGFHASSIVAFGGVVTASRLLRLTDEQMAHAMGITATSVGGLSIGTNSYAREYHAGNAALCGVQAALAAGRGYTVNPDMLEAPGGFLAVFSGGKPDAGSLARPIGDYEITRYLAIKLIPGAHALHPAVEAAIQAARQSGIRPDDVAKILVAGPQSRLVAGKAPTNMIEAIHSLSYYLASAVADRDFSWRHADPEMIQRPAVIRLIPLVEKDPSPPSVRYEWTWGATVTIVTKSGERYASTVDAPRGSAPRGIEWSDVDAKFRALLPQAQPRAGRMEEALKLIHDFDQAQKVSELARLSEGA